MEKLSMCRVCLGEDIRLHSIVGTHLQEMYESLVLMQLETKDGKPLLACYICYARLKNCYELRRSCLQSEELLTKMLSSNESEQVKLQGIKNKKRLTMDNVVHLSMGHKLEMNADNVGVEALKCEVKLEPNDGEGDPTPKESEQDDLSNSEDLTSSNRKYHELVQDTSQAVHKLTAADVTAVASINEVPFTLAEDNKERPTSVPRSERVQYTCDTCQQSYSSKCELERHIRLCSDVWKKDPLHENSKSTHTHTAQKPHHNNVCNKIFTNMNNLTRHMSRTHTGEKLYECFVCKKHFSTDYDIRHHIRTHIAKKLNQCHICKKQFLHNSTLITHMRTHTGEIPFKCDLCNKRFSFKSTFERHMRTHTGEKPYGCIVCKKQFSSSDYVRAHMRTHTGEKPYQCDICKKQFSRKNVLIPHMRTHTGEKPFQCDLCNKQFSRKTALGGHMRTHTSEKPFQCNICKKQFSLKSNLVRHTYIHW